MQKKARLFVVLGTVLILVVVAGIYVNYKMDQVVKSINRPGVLFSDSNTYTPPLDTDAGASDVGGEGSGSASSQQPPAGKDEPLPPQSSSSSSGKVEKDDIVKGVEQRVSRPVEKKDLFKAGLIIIRKLSWDEIEYMYDVGTKDSMSAAELKEVHRILRLRLSADEIQVMQELGRKYGKNLDFLSAREL
jgi:hypothetical protein